MGDDLIVRTGKEKADQINTFPGSQELSQSAMFTSEGKIYQMILSTVSTGELKMLSSREDDIISLLQQVKGTLKYKDAQGRTILHICVICRSSTRVLDAVKYASPQDSEVDEKDNEGLSALHLAVYQGDDETIEWLLLHGADPAKKDNNDNSAIEFSAARSSPHILKILLTHYCTLKVEKHLQDSLYSRLVLLAAAAPSNALVSTKMLLLDFDLASTFLEDGSITHSSELSYVGHVAASARNDELVSWLLESHLLDPLALDKKGWTMLHCAAASGSAASCEAVLKRNATLVEARGGQGMLCPLHLAVMSASVECVQLILTYGANVLSPDENGRTSVHFASITKSFDILDILLKKADHNLASSTADRDGKTPLHYASMADFVEGMELLLSRDDITTALSGPGANKTSQREMRAIDNDGNTPLMGAVAHSSTKAVKFLLKHIGTDDLLVKNNDGRNAMHLASMRTKSETLEILTKFLQQKQQEQTSISILEAALSSKTGPPKDWKEDQQRRCLYFDTTSIGKEYSLTCLHLACLRRESFECVSLLLEIMNQENLSHIINIESNIGLTALHIAAISGAAYASAMLLEFLQITSKIETSVVTTKVEQLPSPLLLACHNGNLHTVKTLLEDGAHMTKSSTANGDSPLHIASLAGAAHCVLLLLQYGCDIDATNDAGRTALHCSSKKGHHIVVLILLKFGAACTKKDKRGRTATMDASASGFDDIASLIEDHLYRKRQLKSLSGTKQSTSTKSDSVIESETGAFDINAVSYISNLSTEKLKAAYDARLLKPYRQYILK